MKLVLCCVILLMIPFFLKKRKLNFWQHVFLLFVRTFSSPGLVFVKSLKFASKDDLLT